MKCPKCGTELEWGDTLECWVCPDCLLYDERFERYEPEFWT